VSYSGGYFSNPADLTDPLLAAMFNWPAMPDNTTFVQAVIYGGDTDTYSLGIDTIYFNQMALADTPYLNGLGHDVILCNHNNGHPVIPTEFGSNELVAFFHDHPRTAVSTPYASTKPSWWPSYCEVKPKTK